jgi:hypothetical protein
LQFAPAVLHSQLRVAAKVLAVLYCVALMISQGCYDLRQCWLTLSALINPAIPSAMAEKNGENGVSSKAGDPNVALMYVR